MSKNIFTILLALITFQLQAQQQEYASLDYYENVYKHYQKNYAAYDLEVQQLVEKEKHLINVEKLNILIPLITQREAFFNQIAAIIRKIAAKHEEISAIKKNNGLLNEARTHLQLAAEKWEEQAEFYRQEAVKIQEHDNFRSANFFKNAFYAYKSAQDKWLKYDSLVLPSASREKIVAADSERVKNLFFSGVNVMKEAAKCYQSASMEKSTVAQTENKNPLNSGKFWLEAAQAQEEYENLTQTVDELEKSLNANTYLLK